MNPTDFSQPWMIEGSLCEKENLENFIEQRRQDLKALVDSDPRMLGWGTIRDTDGKRIYRLLLLVGDSPRPGWLAHEIQESLSELGQRLIEWARSFDVAMRIQWHGERFPIF
jgi:hypothetical protein